MELEKRKGQMHSLAFGQAMAAAAENYKKARNAEAARDCLRLGPPGSLPCFCRLSLCGGCTNYR